MLIWGPTTQLRCFNISLTILNIGCQLIPPIYIYLSKVKDSGYNVKLSYKNSLKTSNTHKRKNRSRGILWFTPPYNMKVVNKLGSEFFKLLKRNFPLTNPLHKMFNKNNIKISYSCMPNINSIINKSNIMKLNKERHNEASKCNCKDKTGCPLKGKYQNECILYKVEVYSGEPHNCKNKKVYFGSTQERLNIGTIIIELVLLTKNINVVLVYLIVCGRLKIGKALIPY